MTWLAPWAFGGLIAVAAPVLVHWLARQRAERLRFPTLQFLVLTPPVSVRRHRLRDVVLLLVRVAIVVAAVAALAQPVWTGPGAAALRPAQAIVVDTSASLQRALETGRAGVDVARETAAALADRSEAEAGARPVVVVPADDVSRSVRQAAAWLAGQDAPRELIVVSDFQVGALVVSDFDGVPADAGVRLVPVPVRGPVPVRPGRAHARLRVLAATAAARAAAAAEAAARTIAGQTPGVTADGEDSGRLLEVALVFPGAAEEDALRASALTVDTPALFELVADVQAGLRRSDATAQPPSDVVFAKQPTGASPDDGLVVFADLDPGSLEAAALMVAILRASAPTALSAAEREPETLSPATLDAWQREPATALAPGRESGRGDGRWLWGLVLAIFAIETWIRRPQVTVQRRMTHADVA